MPKVILNVILIFVSYLIGSINFAVILTRIFYNDDVRNWGSKNAGATNVFRNYNKKVGSVVLLLDILKGISVIILERVVYNKILSIKPSIHIDYLCCISVIIGHCLPIFFEFRGGKAVATATGCLLILNPLIISIAIAVFIAALLRTKTVGISSVFATLSLIPSYLLVSLINDNMACDFFYILVIVSIVTLAHVENIKKYIH